MGSRDVIGHVTIRLPVVDFLSVVYSNHASIWHRYGDMTPQILDARTWTRKERRKKVKRKKMEGKKREKESGRRKGREREGEKEWKVKGRERGSGRKRVKERGKRRKGKWIGEGKEEKERGRERGRKMEKRKGEGKEKEKGKGRWKEDSLRNVGRTHGRTGTKVILLQECLSINLCAILLTRKACSIGKGPGFFLGLQTHFT